MNRTIRHKRIRAKIYGSKERPRLSIFRSNKYIYAQLIDDDAGKTLVSVYYALKNAEKVGESIAKKALEKKIKTIVFDRGGYKYHGRVKALAEAARKEGLKF